MDKSDFIFFFGHTTNSEWDVFSNFYSINNDESKTSEKFFMLGKAIFFEDMESYEKIKKSKTPREAKVLGRKVKNFDDNLWEVYKIEAMMRALREKRSICPEFKEALIKTENKIIVEASPYDRIWGIGYREKEALSNYDKWGQNLLGKCLMRLRKEML